VIQLKGINIIMNCPLCFKTGFSFKQLEVHLLNVHNVKWSEIEKYIKIEYKRELVAVE